MVYSPFPIRSSLPKSHDRSSRENPWRIKVQSQQKLTAAWRANKILIKKYFLKLFCQFDNYCIKNVFLAAKLCYFRPTSLRTYVYLYIFTLNTSVLLLERFFVIFASLTSVVFCIYRLNVQMLRTNLLWIFHVMNDHVTWVGNF